MRTAHNNNHNDNDGGRSVWGMYKASGVASPTYSPPNSGAAAAGAKAKRPLVPPHFNSGDGRAGPSPLMMPRSAFGKARASASNGTSNGGGSGLSTLDGVGGTKGVGAGGGVGYREDSFEYKRTGWNYTLDWVSWLLLRLLLIAAVVHFVFVAAVMTVCPCGGRATTSLQQPVRINQAVVAVVSFGLFSAANIYASLCCLGHVVTLLPFQFFRMRWPSCGVVVIVARHLCDCCYAPSRIAHGSLAWLSLGSPHAVHLSSHL